MPTFIFALLFNFIVRAIRQARHERRKTHPESLCAACFHAHVQYGKNARRRISCAYGGDLNPVQLEVLYCTGYQARNQPAPRAIGFVRQIAPAE
jgi:hypothetical protein